MLNTCMLSNDDFYPILTIIFHWSSKRHRTFVIASLHHNYKKLILNAIYFLLNLIAND